MNRMTATLLTLALLAAAPPLAVAGDATRQGLVADFTFMSGRAATDNAKVANELIPSVGEIFMLGVAQERTGSNLNALRDEMKATLRLATFDASPMVTRTLVVGKAERIVQTSGGLEIAATLLSFTNATATVKIRIEQPEKKPNEAQIVVTRGSRATIGGRDGEPTPYFVLVIEPWPEGLARVGDEGVTSPEITNKVNPVYPESARTAGTQGVVVLEAVIDTMGSVSNVRSIKGEAPELVQAAIEAVRQWRYKPARDAKGQPVAVRLTVTLSFMLQGRDEKSDAAKPKS